MSARRGSFLRKVRPALLAVTALLLLVAQAGALAHGYSHFGRAQQRDAGAAHGAVVACADCAAFAPLLSPAGSAPLPRLPARAAVPEPLALADAGMASGSFTPAYRSRAPPGPA
jgi:hypothetical protein